MTDGDTYCKHVLTYAAGIRPQRSHAALRRRRGSRSTSRPREELPSACEWLLFGSRLRQAAGWARACSVQHSLQMHDSLLRDGDVAHGSLTRILTAPEYHGVFVQMTRSHVCVSLFLEAWAVCYRPGCVNEVWKNFKVESWPAELLFIGGKDDILS